MSQENFFKQKISQFYIKNILKKAGFKIKSGDILRVMDKIRNEDILEILEIAKIIGMERRSDIFSEKTKKDMKKTHDWILNNIIKLISEQEFWEAYKYDIIYYATNEYKINIENQTKNYFEIADIISENDRPYFDLSKYETIEDFVQELSDELEISELSKESEINLYEKTKHKTHGDLTLEIKNQSEAEDFMTNIKYDLNTKIKFLTIKEHIYEGLFEDQVELVDELTIEMDDDMPHEIRNCIIDLQENYLIDILQENIHKSLEEIFKQKYSENILKLKFRETLLECNPKIKERLERDIYISNLMDKSDNDFIEIFSSMINKSGWSGIIKTIIDISPDKKGVELSKKILSERCLLDILLRDMEFIDYDSTLFSLFCCLDFDKNAENSIRATILDNEHFIYDDENWLYFAHMALTQKFMRNEEYSSIVIRKFESKIEKNKSVQKLAGLIIDEKQIKFLNKEELSEIYNIDMDGLYSDPEISIEYMDMKDFCPKFKEISENNIVEKTNKIVLH